MQNAPPLALTRIRNRARRVAGMGLSEIRYRTRQASAKWIDRMQRDRRGGEPRGLLGRTAPALADPAAALRMLREGVPARFFPSVPPSNESAVVAAADKLLTKRFDLLGYRQLWFGDPIDWHLDPVNGKTAPMRHWSEIDPLDPATVGDSKVVWELNRQQWTVTLAQAAAISGDARYAAAALAAIDEWITANPPGYGINWTSSLELALRLMAWTWTLVLLRQSDALTGEALVRVLASIHAHASHIQKFLSRYYSPNTHLTGEALGLFYAGTVFPEFRDAERWRTTGAATLVEQADVQISRDGVYFEQSTCYQRYTCDIYLHFLLLAQRNDIRIPERTRERVSHLVDVLVNLQQPDGAVPGIGDADGGWLLPLTPRAADDHRGLFAIAAALFNRADLARAAGGPAPEVPWLLGQAGVAGFATAAARQPAPKGSRAFADGGYAVMRSGVERDAHHMIVDVGPIGHYGHGHADLLSIQCSVFGDACLVDPGTYGYTAEPEWREYFRGTAAHNTVRVDGLGQAEPSGPFGWKQRPAAGLKAWRSNAELDLVDAAHDAFAAQGVRVTHRRRVIFVKPVCWVVVDDLRGDGTHTAEWSFQFAPIPLWLAGDGSARAVTERGAALWIVPLSGTPLQSAVACGALSPTRGWISTDYGQRVPAPMLVYSATAPLPLRVATVLWPERTMSAPAPSAQPVLDDSGLIAGVRVGNVAVWWDDLDVAVTRG